MNKLLGILVGLILFLAPLYAWITNFWNAGDAALIFLKGGLVWVLLLVGLLTLIVSLSSLKN